MNEKSKSSERRHKERKRFGFYMRVTDDDTQQTVGHLVDVSTIGLRLETPEAPPMGKAYHLHMELTPDISNKLFMFLTARTKWWKPDEIMPNLYHVGFEIMEMSPEDKEIYQRLLEKYGS